MTQRLQDPPQLSPYARSLRQPDPATAPYSASRPVPADQPARQEPNKADEQNEPLTPILPRRPEANSVPPPIPLPDETPHVDEPSLQPASPAGPLSAPPPSSLGHADASDANEETHLHEQHTDETDTGQGNGSSVVRGEPLIVSVTAPEEVKVGGEVMFRMTVRNPRAQAVEGVTVLCTLPEGIVFPGAPQRAFRQRAGRLEPQEERSFDLSLRCDQPGVHCVKFRVTAEGLDEMLESACVTCRDESVRLDVSGPSLRTAGNRAEFVVTLMNLTGKEQPDVHVVIEHEPVLEPREASAGALSEPGRLEWDLGLVRVDERVQIQVEFACLSVSEHTCILSRVTGRNLPLQEVESCLQVVPRREMELEITDDQDPVAVGETVFYVVRVTNHGREAVSGLVLQFDSQGLQPLGVTSDGVDLLSSSEFDPLTGVLSVPLGLTLAANATHVISLEAMATNSGRGSVRATVSQRSGSPTFSALEPTVVNALPGAIASGTP